MRQLIPLIASGLFILGAPQLHAQFGGGGSPTGPKLSGELLKLFDNHKAFSANLEFEVREGGKGNPMTLPGKIAFSEGKTRFEMDLTKARGDQIPPEAIGQLKQMGMDTLIAISLPKNDQSLLIYPGLKSYVEMPINDPQAQKTAEDFDIEITEIGSDEIDGRKCIKNKVVVTDKNGGQQESTVWNATDLKDFPVKIETTEEGHSLVLTFSEITLSKPAADQFAPPPTYTKYDNMMGMMQEIMMKRMGGGAGGPPGG